DPGLVDSAETVAMLSEEHREVLSAMRRLPDRQREALVLRYYLDLNEEEIAAAMGISRGTVKSTTSRGLTALGRLLGESRLARPSARHWRTGSGQPPGRLAAPGRRRRCRRCGCRRASGPAGGSFPCPFPRAGGAEPRSGGADPRAGGAERGRGCWHRPPP